MVDRSTICRHGNEVSITVETSVKCRDDLVHCSAIYDRGDAD